MPLFSIVIPAYNCSKTIHLPLASLACQIFKDFEIVIVDDCSEDNQFYGMHEEVKKFENYMPITIIRRKENGGCGPTLQTGLDAAKGDYFIPIDADDQFATAESLLHYARIIQQRNYPVMVSCAFMGYDPSTGNMNRYSEQSSAFVHGKCFNVAYCRENNITFPNQKWFEDGAFNFLVVNLTNPNMLAYEPTTTYLWQTNPNSITQSRDYNVEVMPYYFAAYERAFPRIKEKDTKQAYAFMCGALTFGYYYWTAFKRRNVAQDRINELINVISQKVIPTGLIEAINEDASLFDILAASDTNAKGNIEAQEMRFIPIMSFNDWLKKHFNKSIKYLEVA